MLISACWILLAVILPVQPQTTAPSGLPQWASIPERVGDFQQDRSRDLTEFGILARYTHGAAVSDVYLYSVPRTADGSPLSLGDEAALTQQTLLKLRGRGYDRVELVEVPMPLREDVRGERIEGIIVGAMVIIEGRPASTYTTLFTVRGYRLKIRTTIRDSEPNINAAVTFVRTFLQGVLNGQLMNASH